MLRWSTSADVERIAECVGLAFGGKDGPDGDLEDLTRRFMRGDYPFMGPADFVLVEDTSLPKVPVVACACYLREEWDFDGISIPVARPEIVGTLREYRRRGLIRAIFGLLHDRAATDGTLLQGITGKRYFYRQFGYEYALDLGARVQLPVALITDLPAEEQEPYRLRQATTADLGSIADCYRQNRGNSLVSLRIPDEFWSYNLGAEENADPLHNYFRVRVVEDRAGRFCGAVLLPYGRNDENYSLHLAVFPSSSNLHLIAPSLIRELRRIAEHVPARKPDVPLRMLSLGLGRDDPLRQVLPKQWMPEAVPPYAWYLRIPDIPAFLQHIAPVLDARLAASPFAGFCGTIAVDLYRFGVQLTFDNGRLASARDCDLTADPNPAKAGLPPLVIIPLLVGYRSLAELRSSYPDAWANDDTQELLDALFPKRPSHLIDL